MTCKPKGKEDKQMQNKKKAGWGSLVRLLAYMWKQYKFVLLLAAALIVTASLSTVYITSSIRALVDQYIQPMLDSGSRDFSPLLSFLMMLAVVGILGVLANYGFSLIMATVSQDTLRSLRNQLFARMQKLPVKYFDTHQHGDIMSIYTNDIDALRQAIEQSIPQLLQSAITIVGVAVSMIMISPLLFLLVLSMVGVMAYVIKEISGKSGRYFADQQKNLGIENGFIEEMMSGQKVVKAFVHEEESIEAFERINDQLLCQCLDACLGEPGKCLLRLDLTGRRDLRLEWYQWPYYWWAHGLPPAQPFLQRTDHSSIATVELCPHGTSWGRSDL